MTEINERTAARFAALARATGVAIATFGILMLAGWGLGLSSLTGVGPGADPIEPGVAASFVLAGWCLWMVCGPGFTSRGPAWMCAVAAIVTAWLAQLTDLVGPGEVTLDASSLASAVALTLLGLGLFMVDVEIGRGRRPANVLAGVALFIPALVLFGYAYEAPALYGGRHGWATPVASAVVMTLLSVGLVSARPRSGFMRVVNGVSMGSAMLRWLLPAIFLVPATLEFARLRAGHAGLVGVQTGIALVALSYVATMATLSYLAASRLHHSDERRAASERDLERNRVALAEAELQAARVREVELRQSHALELNDDVVQGLAVAKLALELEDKSRAVQALDHTLHQARRIVNGLVGSPNGEQLGEGDFVRDRAAVIRLDAEETRTR